MVNIYMKDAYRVAFYDVIKETQITTGYDLPEELEAYVVMLLAHFIDRHDYLPERSFAESYLKLRRPADLSAKELGDTCLFVTGVFPTYGRKHGLNRRYYQDIGIGSYEMVAEVMHPSLFTQLATHFHFLSDFIEITTNSAKQRHSNLFR
jgi:hypothetical protein